MPRPVRLGLALAAALTLAGARPAAAYDGKVVVELYTSQGCSSCPPADAYLASLARRDDVIALAFHVGYWNYIGWNDPFTLPEATTRQRAYRRALGLSYVYTPQAVIDGWAEAVGSDRAKVARLIRMSEESLARIPVTVDRVAGGRARLRIPAQPGKPSVRADIWLGFYDARHTTRVRAGENRGATLTDVNVVRSFRRIGGWTGQRVDRLLDLDELGAPGRDAGVVLVQIAGEGRILGATTFSVDGK